MSVPGFHSTCKKRPNNRNEIVQIDRPTDLLIVDRIYNSGAAVTGLCDNASTTCSSSENGKMLPDRSDCHYYYQCLGGTYRRQACSPGLVFDLDISPGIGCIQPDDSFDCEYRCKTPAPSTAEPTTATVALTTTEDVTSSTTTEDVTSSSRTSDVTGTTS